MADDEKMSRTFNPFFCFKIPLKCLKRKKNVGGLIFFNTIKLRNSCFFMIICCGVMEVEAIKSHTIP